MKIRYSLITLLAVLATTFGVVSAQHQPMHHGTPEPMQHHGTMDMTNTSMGAFYFTVTNTGKDADRLVSAETDAAEVVEIHNVEMTNGVMQMVPQPDGVEIAAGASLTLKPGSYHIMLIGLTDSLMEGDEFTATLHFEHAGDVEITVPVYALEPKADAFADPVKVGDDLEISGVWARQAPKLSPAATPGN